MKLKSLSALAFLVAVLASAPNSLSGSRDDADRAIRALRNVPPPELPAKAAEVVANSSAENRSAVAAAVLESVSQRTPSSAPAVRSALVSSGALSKNAHVPAPEPPRSSSSGNEAHTPNTPNPHSRFDIAPPHGGNPPGHNGQPDRHGPPPFVDYTKPRGF